MRRALTFLGVFTLLASIQGTAGLSTWPVDEDKTPSLPQDDAAVQRAFRPPPGCICIDTDQVPCQKFDCRCTCNLRSAACDANCCCDPDCSDEETARFKASGKCLPEGPSNKTVVRKCIDIDADPALAAVNPRFRMDIEDFDAFDAIFCVVVENDPVVGRFFTDPVSPGDVMVDASVLDDSDVRDANPFVREYEESLSSRSAVFSGQPDQYSVGDPIKAAMSQNGDRTLFKRGILSLPGQQFSSDECSFTRIATYRDDAFLLRQLFSDPSFLSIPRQHPVLRSALLEREVYPNQPQMEMCRQRVSLSEDGCKAIGTHTLIRDVLVGSRPNVNPSSASGYLNVELGSAYFQDSSTGDINSLDGFPETEFVTDGTTCSCNNITSEVIYRIFHDGEGLISRVLADVVTTRIEGECGSMAGLPITSGVTNEPEQNIRNNLLDDATLGNGNAVPRQRSGNPGYERSSPVLAGKPSGDGDFIEAATQGLQLRGPDLNGRCSQENATFVGVRFNEDLVFGCRVTLTTTELEDLCDADDIPPEFGPDDPSLSRIGIFGNADPAAPFQWMPIEFPTSTPSTSFSQAATTCSGIVSGLKIEFLIAQVGEKNNPQYKIASVRTSRLEDTWTHTNPDGVAAFQYKTIITWSVLPDETLETFVPPHPRILPKLPRDLFYPFEISEEDQGENSARDATPRILGFTTLLLMLSYLMGARYL